jgi:hypothetical protein
VRRACERQAEKHQPHRFSLTHEHFRRSAALNTNDTAIASLFDTPKVLTVTQLFSVLGDGFRSNNVSY